MEQLYLVLTLEQLRFSIEKDKKLNVLIFYHRAPLVDIDNGAIIWFILETHKKLDRTLCSLTTRALDSIQYWMIFTMATNVVFLFHDNHVVSGNFAHYLRPKIECKYDVNGPLCSVIRTTIKVNLLRYWEYNATLIVAAALTTTFAIYVSMLEQCFRTGHRQPTSWAYHSCWH